MDTAYFEIPTDTKKKSPRGSSPILVDNLIEQFKGATEIKISFFLYNNPYIHSKLEKMADEYGCRILIYTIPLDGYDKRKKAITLSNGKTSMISKYDYALKIKDRIKHPIELRYVPHTNVWYEQKTSRGADSYALHNKSILIKYGDNSYKCISTSSNFALGDPPHSENVYITDNKADINMFNTYFELLHNHSFSLEEYQEFRLQKYDFEYITQPTNIQDTFNTCYFTAPFIKYNGTGSNHYVQDKIIDFIKNPKERLYFCFQHISDINSFDRKAKNIVESIGEIAKSKSNVDIKLLKQTRANNQKQGSRTTQAENYLKQFNNIKQMALFPIVHDKFIIVDNNLLVTTANLTSTQFAWAENYNMKYYISEEDKRYIIPNTFSDINSFHFVYDNQLLVNDYLNHFNNLWNISHTV
ncbi:phospholipase D-like domain-containing protein [Rossellomorea vietnamensis]|uniref:phospholipase D-like domain-containing protein n=1 Tax=Rossellomorea vietnamensis TaxID=218284 RepID=UPI003CF67D1A